jgi:hypothetical protein
VSGYDELVDMSEVEQIVLPSVGRIRTLARLSASMPESKLAVVASGDLAYGLGRSYEAYREVNDQSSKRFGVFQSLADARPFRGLGGKRLPGGWAWRFRRSEVKRLVEVPNL